MLTALLFLNTCIAILPTTNAAEPDLQTQTISILSDVVNIKTEQYTLTQNIERVSIYLEKTQKETDIYLSSPDGSFRVTCSFIKDNLHLLYFSDLKGQPTTKQPTTNTVDIAKGFLERYRMYSDLLIYSECASMLENVDASNNFTKADSNILFEVSNFNQKIVTYKWTYIDSIGVIAERKNIVLNFEDGQLIFFLNNWVFYNVAGVPKISVEKAVDIAIEASKTFSYEVTDKDGFKQTVSGFNIASDSSGDEVLVYQNFDTEAAARGGDPFTLYPTWVVPLGFDRFYPGDVSSMVVYLWADTGEVNHMQEVVVDSNLLTSYYGNVIEVQHTINADNTAGTAILPVQFLLVFSLFSIVALISNRKRFLKFIGSKKLSKLCVVALGISLFFSASLPIVSADIDPQSKSEIYACIHSLNGYHNDTVDGAEREASKTVCSYIEEVTSDAGYSVSNWCWDPGYGTTVNRVGQNAHNDELNYDRTAIFYVGHKYSDNFAIQDDQGYPISYELLGGNISSNEHFFIFLWVCNQAQAPTYGIPANWTNNPNMSSDGFANPDYDDQCYISFLGYSPMISSYPESEGHPTFYGEGYLGPCKEFIIFFYYRVTQNYSVHDALNFASSMYFSDSYADSVLNQGYSCWWPGSGTGYLSYSGYFPEDFRQYPGFQNTPDNRMRVFGDSSIKLYQPLLTLSASDGLSPTFTIAGQSQILGSCRLIPNVYTINVTDVPNYTFTHFTYKGSSYGRPANIQIASDGELVAHYTPNPTYYTLSISATGGGYTSPSGNQQYLSGSNAQVISYPDSGKVLGYWLKDGSSVGYSTSINVYMDAPHTLQAVFVSEPTYKYVSSIAGCGGPAYNPTAMAGPLSDGQYTSISAAEPYGINGWVSGALNAQTSGHVYVYGYGSGAVEVYTSAGYLTTVYPSGSASWIDCGICASSISSITFYARGWAQFYIDSVHVQP